MTAASTDIRRAHALLLHWARGDYHGLREVLDDRDYEPLICALLETFWQYIPVDDDLAAAIIAANLHHFASRETPC